MGRTENKGADIAWILKGHNDYALWLIASEEADCYLLKENLAKLRTKWGMLGKFLLTNNIKWRV